MSTKKKTWTGQEKLAIVLQGLRGNCRISELCNEHGITQGMFYRWRDQLLNDGAKLFAHGGVDHEVERLQRENRKLKDTIGELTMELKRWCVKSQATLRLFSENLYRRVSDERQWPGG